MHAGSDLGRCCCQVLYLLKELDLGLDKVGMAGMLLPQIINYKAVLEVSLVAGSPRCRGTPYVGT
jgi:hypothetical protein